MFNLKKILYPVIFIISSSIAYAQKNILNEILKPFFGWDIAGTYQRAYAFIDFVLYLFIFIYITRYALSKRFEGSTGKSLSVVIGIMLAIGMAVFERMFQFNIGKLAPLAGLIFFIVIAMLSFNVLKGFGSGFAGASSWAFILIYGALSGIIPQFLDFLYKHVPLLEALLYLALMFAIFGAIKGLIDIISKWFKNNDPPVPVPPIPPVPPVPPTVPPDFSEELTALNNLINRYKQIYELFVNSCNDILLIHHRHVQSREGYEAPEPDVSPEQWAENNRLYQELTRKAGEINDLINTITNNDRYSEIITEQNEILIRLMNEWGALQMGLRAFLDEFRIKYENGERP